MKEISKPDVLEMVNFTLAKVVMLALESGSCDEKGYFKEIVDYLDIDTKLPPSNYVWNQCATAFASMSRDQFRLMRALVIVAAREENHDASISYLCDWILHGGKEADEPVTIVGQ